MSGSMELPTSSETVGRVAVYLADVKVRVVRECLYSRSGELKKILQVLVMARLDVAVWWWCSSLSLHTP